MWVLGNAGLAPGVALRRHDRYRAQARGDLNLGAKDENPKLQITGTAAVLQNSVAPSQLGGSETRYDICLTPLVGFNVTFCVGQH